MKRIKINGFEYYYNTKTEKLFVDETMTQEVDKQFFTPNEYQQFLNAIR
jgi:hypothetical protein